MRDEKIHGRIALIDNEGITQKRDCNWGGRTARSGQTRRGVRGVHDAGARAGGNRVRVYNEDEGDRVLQGWKLRIAAGARQVQLASFCVDMGETLAAQGLEAV
jgi:hypothetical protein